MRVGEDADVIEVVIAHERLELLDVRGRFSRETDNEGRAQGDAGHRLADVIEQTVVLLPRPGPFHPLQDGIGRVLQRQVDVLADMLALGHRRKRVIADRRGVQIEEPDPFDTRHPVQPPQQAGERASLLPVDAVKRRVLRDEQELLDAPRRERFGFAND